MSESEETRKLGRAAAVGLTREAVVEAALDLLNETGVSGFSVRELARRLGVFPAAIYHHLGGSKQDLFSQLSGLITTPLMAPEEVRDDWRWTLKELLYRYRSAALKNPHLANMIGANLLANGPSHIGLVEIILGALRRAGYDGPPLVDAMNMLIGGVWGFITMELAPHMRSDASGWKEAFSDALDELPEEEYPECVRAMPLVKNRAFVLRWTNGTEVPFDSGFEALVEGMLLALEARRPIVMAQWAATAQES